MSAIDVDAEGNAYVGGTTQSDDFPSPAAPRREPTRWQGDGFLSKLGPTGTPLLTYMGGTGYDDVPAAARAMRRRARADGSVYLVVSRRHDRNPRPGGSRVNIDADFY